ncbi:ChaN family lipoprotein [Campylobacter blaseri]|nr:ChaN family lipoprotein [Campylobacter blaseri]
MNKCIFLVVPFLFFGCSSLNTPNSLEQITFNIINNNTSKEISFNEFIDEILKYDIVLIGEEHNNHKHILVETKIIEALNSKKDVEVVLEMMSVDKQIKIDNAKINGYENKNLLKEIDWSDSWDKSYYKRLVLFIFNSKIDLVAGNLSKSEIQTIFNGAYPLQGKASTTFQVKEKIKDMIIDTSHKIDDTKTIDKFVQIQQYKDRRMADKLVSSNKTAILIAGKYHTRKDIGIPLHIEDFNKSKTFISIGLQTNIKNEYVDYSFKIK